MNERTLNGASIIYPKGVSDTDPDWIALPLQGKPERRHLYEWVTLEEVYVEKKFGSQRGSHDETLMLTDLSAFWTRQIVQYLDRAELFLGGYHRSCLDKEEPDTKLKLAAQQAMAKCMMTSKGLVESSIRVFGPLPLPGVPSGEIKEWSY